MGFYTLAATAIPALWVAAGLHRQDVDEPTRLAALGRTLLRTLLAAGEVAALTSVGVGHDGWATAIFTTSALIIGGLVVFVRSSAPDLTRLNVPTVAGAGVTAGLVFLVFAFAARR